MRNNITYSEHPRKNKRNKWEVRETFQENNSWYYDTYELDEKDVAIGFLNTMKRKIKKTKQ